MWPCAGKPRGRPPLEPDLDRRYVPLEGCHNFRDLGGHRTRDGRGLRRGVLFRSDALHYLSEGDVRRLRDDLGLRCIVDVRRSSEVGTDGRGPLARPPVAYHHVPFFPESAASSRQRYLPDDLGELYFRMLEWGGPAIGRVIELACTTGGPLVFHCAAGKDRTGVISAVILSLLGVAESDVADDYAWTSRNLDRILERLRSSPSYQTVFTDLPPSTLHAEPETMHTLLGLVRRHHGSMRDYARGIGVDDDALARLEARVLT